MSVHLKILGIIYMALGGFIVAFVLIALGLGVADYFGAGDGMSGQGLSGALVVFFTLIYPAIWIIQTGLRLYRAERSARMWGIILAAVLLIGLNIMLLFLNAQSQNTGLGFEIFHGLMIALGVYSLVLLVPRSIIAHLKD